jgi:hypothetical protein
LKIEKNHIMHQTDKVRAVLHHYGSRSSPRRSAMPMFFAKAIHFGYDQHQKKCDSFYTSEAVFFSPR